MAKSHDCPSPRRACSFAQASVLIRRPVAEVFAACTSADSLTRFWLARASASLEQGKRVHWEFLVKGASVDTFVERLEPNSRILIRWSDGTSVDWSFEPRADETTRVSVDHFGFEGDHDAATKAAIEATQGFTLVLCDLKLLLERGAPMDLVRDKAALIQEQLDASS